MRCCDFTKLRFLHHSAEYRVWRYANPNKAPALKVTTGIELAELLACAIAEETSTWFAMEDHKETCTVCEQTEDGENSVPLDHVKQFGHILLSQIAELEIAATPAVHPIL